MRRATVVLWAVVLCAAAIAGAPAEPRAEEDWIGALLVDLQRATGEAGAGLEALLGERDAARQARDHLAAARSQIQAALGAGDPATQLQSAMAARRALQSAQPAPSATDRGLSAQLGGEIQRAGGALESFETAIRRNQSAERQKAAAGTAGRHLGTVGRLLDRILKARQARLDSVIAAYRGFVSKAAESLGGLDKAAQNAAR